MQRSIGFLLLGALPGIPVAPSAEPKKPGEAPVAAIVETTLNTDADQIRQYAFDGDANTCFVSAKNATRADHFDLVFDKPVALGPIEVATGRPDGRDKLEAGTLEVSANGKTFEEVAKFREGMARAKPGGRQVRVLRIKPATDLRHPLAIREFKVESDPPVAVFKYPVEFVVDVSDAPEMKVWAEKAARICEQQYGMINEELKSEGFKPRRVVRMALKSDYRGVAEVGDGRITGSVKWFTAHPNDFGAMVHETVHVVQDYRLAGNPGWLVEGIADYIRFFKYEPGKLGPISARRAHYDGSFRVTAAFLAYLTEKYDKQIVRKLNKMMREGEYKEDSFKILTGKTVRELDKEWRATLIPDSAR
jgi:hypothetical protein